MRDRHTEGDPAETLPGDRVGDLPAQRLEAEPVAVLQEHQPQVRLDRHRRQPEHRMEVQPERLEEGRVVQQPVDVLQLVRQPEAHLGEDRFPQGGLSVYRSQHDGLDPYLSYGSRPSSPIGVRTTRTYPKFFRGK
jgi:hypothetical protein